MPKRPRSSNHLRLVEAAAARAEPPADAPRQASPSAGPGEDLADILADAAVGVLQLTWLGWSHACDVQLRLARCWLGPDRQP